jgi:hypothetical protein
MEKTNDAVKEETEKGDVYDLSRPEGSKTYERD